MRTRGLSFKVFQSVFNSPLYLLYTSGLSSLTSSKARCVVFNACQIQIVVPAFQVLVHAVALAARLGVVVTVVAPADTRGTSH